MAIRFSPGRGCGCTSCTIVSEDFSIDTLAAWSLFPTPSAFTVTEGLLRTTGVTAEIRAIHNKMSPTGHGKVSVRARAFGQNARAWAIGSYSGPNEFLYLDMRISDVADSTLKLMRRDAGSDSQIGETHSFQGEFGEWYDLGLCWDGEEAIGTLDGRPYTVFGDYELEGTRGGVGGIPNTPMEFDDFLFSKHDVDDPACPSCGADRGDRETQCRWSDHSDEPLPTVFMTIRCLGPRCSICDSGLTSSPIVDVPLLPIGSVSGFMAWRSVGGFWGLQCYTGPSIEGPDNGFLLLYNFGARFVQLPGNVASLNPFNLSHVLRSIPCNGLSLNHSHYGLVLWQDFCRGGLVDCTDPETQFVQRFLVEVNE